MTTTGLELLMHRKGERSFQRQIYVTLDRSILYRISLEKRQEKRQEEDDLNIIIMVVVVMRVSILYII